MKAALFLFLLLAIMFLVGCGVVTPSWDLKQSDPTDVVPTKVRYDFITDHPISDSAHRAFDFSVVKDEDSLKPVLDFSVDAYRYDQIPIVRGAFYHAWGSIGGLDCPTDSYAISGHFIEPGRAKGVIKLAYNGQITASAAFTAMVIVLYPE